MTLLSMESIDTIVSFYQDKYDITGSPPNAPPSIMNNQIQRYHKTKTTLIKKRKLTLGTANNEHFKTLFFCQLPFDKRTFLTT